ncbi:MAG: phosphorylase [Deltaproteobacteria bacterium]|nr:MAG: phosphorylase [Deltaproteobacteria bacterium]
MRILGIVVPLRSEARSLTRVALTPGALNRLQANTFLTVSGIGARKAGVAAERLVSEGATALLSWGSAGALHSKLSSGDLILPKTVLTPLNTSFSVDGAWHNRLAQRLNERLIVHTESLLQSPSVLTNPTEKMELGKQHAAIAVDMESASVAEVAMDVGIPFAAVRAIVDPLDMTLPSSVMSAIDDHGRVLLPQLLVRLLRKPAEILPLIHLGRCFRAARSTLGSAAKLAGKSFLLP